MSGSIIGRVGALLIYLAKTRSCEEGWLSFLSDEASSLLAGEVEWTISEIIRCIRWTRVILSGHSQGAGHAAYIAQQIEVARVVLFSGPQEGYVCLKLPGVLTEDQDDTSHSKHWLENPWKTSEVFAMMHKQEEGTASKSRSVIIYFVHHGYRVISHEIDTNIQS
jgi:hypothetical protein